MRQNGGNGTINITSTGTLIIDGDVTAYVTTCVNNGWIKAYNGAGTVMRDYNVTTPGKTTVWATISDKATIPNPISDANNVPVSGTNLSWKAGVTAASHNVYFGTVSNDVNSAERLLGDLNGNGIVDFNDVSRLTLYWLANPAGSEPYAGVNDDDIVDFFDYALFSQDWRNTAAPVFKGNQDANIFSPGALAFAATYYWRIDEVNGPNTVRGDIWNFTTQTGKASIRTPANNEPNVLSRAVLAWTAGVGAISHDVYFGTADPPVTLVSDNQPATVYNPGTPIANSTTYYWRIDENYGTGTVQGDVWNFTTIDAANEPDIVFVQASDPQMEWNQCNPGGIDDLKWGITINKINVINPDFMLVTGDLINASGNDTQAAEYKSYRAALNPTIECYEVPGNHDISEPPDAGKYLWWKNNFGYPLDDDSNNPWYSFTYGDSIFIGLDDIVLRSPFGGQDVNEMNWLTLTLADANEAGYAHKFVFMHVALFITSAGEAYNSAENLPLVIRGQLLDLFHEYGVKVVMAGHRHTNNYAVDGDLQMYTTTSCTCGLGSPPTTPGIRIFKVYSDRVEQEFRTLDSLP
jgi:predicted MPP superfamily phosphohydrolase